MGEKDPQCGMSEGDLIPYFKVEALHPSRLYLAASLREIGRKIENGYQKGMTDYGGPWKLLEVVPDDDQIFDSADPSAVKVNVEIFQEKEEDQ